MEKYEDYDFTLSYKESLELEKRITELHDSYDWNNYEFTDPTTGKKGLKDITGFVIIPPCYDGFMDFRSFMDSPHDVIGTAYEVYVASHLKGERGQYFTNRLVVNMMVKMANPSARDIILENCTTSLIRIVAA